MTPISSTPVVTLTELQPFIDLMIRRKPFLVTIATGNIGNQPAIRARFLTEQLQIREAGAMLVSFAIVTAVEQSIDYADTIRDTCKEHAIPVSSGDITLPGLDDSRMSWGVPFV